MRWSYQTGRLSRDSDRKIDRAALKEMRKAARKKKLIGTNVVHRKWLRFGGGFYGTAALWTFLVAELVDLFSLIVDWPGLGEIFAGGPVGFLIRLFLNQIGNFGTAMTWFGFWSDMAGDFNIGLLFLLVIGSYAVGRRLAKSGPV